MRISNNDLNILVNELNELTGNPQEHYFEGRANVGNYHINSAYGGVELDQMTNESGGIRSVSPNGYGTKKELYTFLTGVIEGIKISKKS